ncbi:hypothetical protein LCGC14_1632230 [marine sediment metagenome]|uniref:Uncharacterized protein n=1 Tax=marine sediment metagenome TaxID=412755 RepID=A0A0F9KHW0_9ZZZZ
MANIDRRARGDHRVRAAQGRAGVSALVCDGGRGIWFLHRVEGVRHELPGLRAGGDP